MKVLSYFVADLYFYGIVNYRIILLRSMNWSDSGFYEFVSEHHIRGTIYYRWQGNSGAEFTRS